MSKYVEKLDKRKARMVARLAAENRRFVRGVAPLSGRFLARNGWEYPCKVADISPGGLRVLADGSPVIGEIIVMMIEQIGRVEGKVVRQTSDGFAIQVVSSAKKRDQISDKLTWLMNVDRLGLQDDRESGRSKRSGLVYVQLHDGTRFQARAIDMSLTGMAIETEEHVVPGEVINIGKLSGRVTRIIPTGFAVRFDAPKEASQCA